WPPPVTWCSTSRPSRWACASSSPPTSWSGWPGRSPCATRCTGSGISTTGTCSASSTGRRTPAGRRLRRRPSPAPRTPASPAAAITGALDPGFAGGSYLIVQKYVHDMSAWNALSVEEQERVIGRTKLDDIELPDDVKPSNSHVAVNTITEPDGTERKVVRANMPFGSVGAGEFGTYYAAYCATPSVAERMLGPMFTGDPPGNYDRILDFSPAVTGNLFFVPPAGFLDDLPDPPAPSGAAPVSSSPSTPPSAPAADGSLGIGGLKRS